ncbi:hypothetical protein NQ315_016312 [Exocentrus adspersus]|uniref:Uncharacterized protein n=1 Tax=Exocentrus adspersus TaxID=1586481 RepID=A0AAV8VPA8_9CUCU|nr:hypothetical protein NQ315_016312 [Exocentrus adspersus]
MGIYDFVNYVVYDNPVSKSVTHLIKSSKPPPIPSVTVITEKVPLWKLAAENGPFIRIAGLMGASAVILGAYGAHRAYPKDKAQELKPIFETANRFHFFHSLALLGVPMCRSPMLVGTLLISGTVLFSGTCYYHAFSGENKFGKLAPIGGVYYLHDERLIENGTYACVLFQISMMKFLVVLVLALVGAIAAPADDVDVAGDVKKVIEEILDALPEPLVDAKDQSVSLDLGFEKLDFNFSKILLSGIKALDITTLDYDKETGRLDYVLTLKDVEFDLEFDLVLAGVLDADNAPIIKLGLNGLELGGYAVVDTSSSPHKVTDFQLLVTLDGAEVDLTGILNDDALTDKLNNLLGEQLPTIVNDIAKQLEPALSPLIKSIINIIIRATS